MIPGLCVYLYAFFFFSMYILMFVCLSFPFVADIVSSPSVIVIVAYCSPHWNDSEMRYCMPLPYVSSMIILPHASPNYCRLLRFLVRRPYIQFTSLIPFTRTFISRFRVAILLSSPSFHYICMPIYCPI